MDDWFSIILKPAKESIYLKGPNVLTEYFVTKQIIFEEDNILLIMGVKHLFTLHAGTQKL